MLGGLASLALAAATGGADIDALMHAWAGQRDTSEAVTVGQQPAEEGRERRISTLVVPLPLPWLGPHVLYLEEFPYDEPDSLRRQLVIQLEQAPGGAVRARLYTLVHPELWAHLDRRPELLSWLAMKDLRHFEGCDLTFNQVGPQFKGGTVGRRCIDTGGELYVEYQLVLDASLYWYRRRLLRVSDSALKEEIVGFNWFELNEARLFACRIDWAADGGRAGLKPLMKMDLHDKGGHGEIMTPDGRRYVLTLHSQDWPFAAEHDSLVLLLSEPDDARPIATAWAVVDDGQISLELSWLRVRCGAIEPDPDEVHG